MTIRRQCTLIAKEASSLLGCIRQSTASRLRKVILPVYSALRKHRIIEMFGLAGTFKDDLVPTPLPWTATSFTRTGFSKPHLT